MKNKCLVKHVFPGGNTTNGFHSFFNQILSQDEANHIISFKGGPGVGKSSIMKKIGRHMTSLNYHIEYHHCSSDPNSLDAIMIPDLKVALMDGTSPHIVDPINPGVVDEIINLGQYWNEDGIRSNKDKIMKVNKERKRMFSKAYQYLKAAKKVYETYETTEKMMRKNKEFNKIKVDIINDIFRDNIYLNKIGKKRDLFSYGLTPIGITHFRDTIICNAKTKYSFMESVGISSEEIMNDIIHEALKRGLDIECYHSPIKIEKVDDILIPELNISISANNQYNKCEFEYDKEVDLTILVNKDIQEQLIDEINVDRELFEVLLYKGLNFINKAKDLHEELESYYIPHMNFKEIDKLIPRLIDKILSYE